MKSAQNKAVKRPAKIQPTKFPTFNQFGQRIDGMEVFLGICGDGFCRAVGFYNGSISVFEHRHGEEELTPLKIGQAVRECEKLTALGNAAALDCIEMSGNAQVKFYRLVAAALG